jgi:hypothetical protein
MKLLKPRGTPPLVQVELEGRDRRVIEDLAAGLGKPLTAVDRCVGPDSCYVAHEGRVIHLQIRHSLPGNRLPDCIGDLSGLQTLTAAEVGLESIPESIGRLAELRELHLHGNALNALPSEVGQLKALEWLALNGNRIKRLPASICELPALKILGLVGNRLTELPPRIGDLCSLEKLWAFNNQLTELPSSIGHLAALQFLGLQNNRLTSVPSSLGDLHALEHLNLENNRITFLPGTLVGLTVCYEFWIRDNPVTGDPEGDPSIAFLWLQCLRHGNLSLLGRLESYLGFSGADLVDFALQVALGPKVPPDLVELLFPGPESDNFADWEEHIWRVVPPWLSRHPDPTAETKSTWLGVLDGLFPGIVSGVPKE